MRPAEEAVDGGAAGNPAFCESCLRFNENCLTCDDTTCLTCKSGFFNEGTANCKSCSDTESNCLTCTADVNAETGVVDKTATCNSCATGFYLNLYGDTPLTDGAKACVACSLLTQTKETGVAANCIECSSDRTAGGDWAGSALDAHCTACAEGMFVNYNAEKTAFSCDACADPNCKSCSDVVVAIVPAEGGAAVDTIVSVCADCNTNWFKKAGDVTPANEAVVCSDCGTEFTDCMECDSTECTKCSNGKYPDVADASDTSTTKTTVCKDCEEGCSTCSVKDKCESCTDTSVMCENGYNWNTNTFICEFCITPNCASCTDNVNKCLACD